MRWTLMGAVLLSTALRAAAVWPQPTTVTNGSTVILLSPSFNIVAPNDAPGDILAAIDRCAKGLLATRHQYLSVRRGDEFFEPSESIHVAGQTLRTLNLRYSGAASHPSILEEAVKTVEQRDESYNLTVPVSGAATLSAGTSLGLLRGLTTFEQLFYRRHSPRNTSCSGTPEQAPLVVADPFGHAGSLYAPFGPYDIYDEPTFGWRSILLDTSRSWFPIADLEKMLDAMRFVKLNVFHWHIIDSHSFPAILFSHPELAATGAYTPHQTYSEDDITHVIGYAGERGIDVVLEFDMPGHTTSIGYAYPEYVACLEAQPWSDYAVEPPAGQLRFVLPGLVQLVKDLLHDALRLVSSSYFSTGGDEIDAACYTTDDITQQALKSGNQTLDQALASFLNMTQGVLASHGKNGVLWQDMISEHTTNVLLPDTIVQVWVSSADAKAVIERGYRVVHAASDYFYLDCGRGNWVDQASGGNSWCDPYKSWARVYSFDPYTNLTDAEKMFVLGGQASLWTEQTDPTNMETIMWPRAAALAEVFWGGREASQYPLGARHKGSASVQRSAVPPRRPRGACFPYPTALVRRPSWCMQIAHQPIVCIRCHPVAAGKLSTCEVDDDFRDSAPRCVLSGPLAAPRGDARGSGRGRRPCGRRRGSIDNSMALRGPRERTNDLGIGLPSSLHPGSQPPTYQMGAQGYQPHVESMYHQGLPHAAHADDLERGDSFSMQRPDRDSLGPWDSASQNAPKSYAASHGTLALNTYEPGLGSGHLGHTGSTASLSYVDEDGGYHRSPYVRPASAVIMDSKGHEMEMGLVNSAAGMGGRNEDYSGFEYANSPDPYPASPLQHSKHKANVMQRALATVGLSDSGKFPIEQRIERRRNQLWRQKHPYVSWLLVVVMTGVMIFALIRNNAVTGLPIATKPTFNYMIGPTPSVLINIGARFIPCMKQVDALPPTFQLACLNDTSNPPTTACSIEEICGFGGFDGKEPNQGFRFILPIFLHVGVIHLILNMVAQVWAAGQVEREMGSIAFTIVYFAGGIYGFILGGNFSRTGIPSVGASGALFATNACVLVDLLLHWQYEERPKLKAFFLAIEFAIGIAIGYIPNAVDGLAHLGGFAMGLLFGIILYPAISPTRRHKIVVWVLRAIAAALIVLAFVLTTKNFYTDDPNAACTWCRFLSCIPTASNERCKGTGITTTTINPTRRWEL